MNQELRQNFGVENVIGNVHLSQLMVILSQHRISVHFFNVTSLSLHIRQYEYIPLLPCEVVLILRKPPVSDNSAGDKLLL
jgi:hypothetical protein